LNVYTADNSCRGRLNRIFNPFKKTIDGAFKKIGFAILSARWEKAAKTGREIGRSSSMTTAGGAWIHP
jgi:hypothetical protein